MTRYAKYFKFGRTPQTQPASPEQARNAAGGFAFVVTPWTRLERFLILGAEGGTYYASEQKLVLANARGVAACLDEDGLRAVAMIVAISEAGRAPTQGPAIFALAMACAHPHDATRTAALAALPPYLRTALHDTVEEFGHTAEDLAVVMLEHEVPVPQILDCLHWLRETFAEVIVADLRQALRTDRLTRR